MTSIHGNRVFISDDYLQQLHLLHEKEVLELSLTFAPENKLSFKEVRKLTNEYVLFSPNTIWYYDSAFGQIILTSTTTETE